MVRIGDVVEASPLVGGTFGLVRTSIKVYDSHTPQGAVCEALKGILVDCAPPNVKYPLLCGYLATSAVVTYCTGANPLAASSVLNAARLIIEEAELG